MDNSSTKISKLKEIQFRKTRNLFNQSSTNLSKNNKQIQLEGLSQYFLEVIEEIKLKTQKSSKILQKQESQFYREFDVTQDPFPAKDFVDSIKSSFSILKDCHKNAFQYLQEFDLSCLIDYQDQVQTHLETKLNFITKLYMDIFLKYQEILQQDNQQLQQLKQKKQIPRVQVGSLEKEPNLENESENEEQTNEQEITDQDPLLAKYKQGQKDYQDLLNNRYQINSINSVAENYLQQVIKQLKKNKEILLDNNYEELLEEMKFEQKKNQEYSLRELESTFRIADLTKNIEENLLDNVKDKMKIYVERFMHGFQNIQEEQQFLQEQKQLSQIQTHETLLEQSQQNNQQQSQKSLQQQGPQTKHSSQQTELNVYELESQIARLQKQVIQYQDQIPGFKKLEENYWLLKIDYKDLETEKKQVLENVDHLMSRISDIQQEQYVQEVKYDELKEENDKLKEEVKQLYIQIDELDEDHMTLNNDNNNDNDNDDIGSQQNNLEKEQEISEQQSKNQDSRLQTQQQQDDNISQSTQQQLQQQQQEQDDSQTYQNNNNSRKNSQQNGQTENDLNEGDIQNKKEQRKSKKQSLEEQEETQQNQLQQQQTQTKIYKNMEEIPDEIRMQNVLQINPQNNNNNGPNSTNQSKYELQQQIQNPQKTSQNSRKESEQQQQQKNEQEQQNKSLKEQSIEELQQLLQNQDLNLQQKQKKDSYIPSSSSKKHSHKHSLDQSLLSPTQKIKQQQQEIIQQQQQQEIQLQGTNIKLQQQQQQQSNQKVSKNIQQKIQLIKKNISKIIQKSSLYNHQDPTPINQQQNQQDSRKPSSKYDTLKYFHDHIDQQQLYEEQEKDLQKSQQFIDSTHPITLDNIPHKNLDNIPSQKSLLKKSSSSNLKIYGEISFNNKNQQQQPRKKPTPIQIIPQKQQQQQSPQEENTQQSQKFLKNTQQQLQQQYKIVHQPSQSHKHMFQYYKSRQNQLIELFNHFFKNYSFSQQDIDKYNQIVNFKHPNFFNSPNQKNSNIHHTNISAEGFIHESSPTIQPNSPKYSLLLMKNKKCLKQYEFDYSPLKPFEKSPKQLQQQQIIHSNQHLINQSQTDQEKSYLFSLIKNNTNHLKKTNKISLAEKQQQSHKKKSHEKKYSLLNLSNDKPQSSSQQNLENSDLNNLILQNQYNKEISQKKSSQLIQQQEEIPIDDQKINQSVSPMDISDILQNKINNQKNLFIQQELQKQQKMHLFNLDIQKQLQNNSSNSPLKPFKNQFYLKKSEKPSQSSQQLIKKFNNNLPLNYDINLEKSYQKLSPLQKQKFHRIRSSTELTASTKNKFQNNSSIKEQEQEQSQQQTLLQQQRLLNKDRVSQIKNYKSGYMTQELYIERWMQQHEKKMKHTKEKCLTSSQQQKQNSHRSYSSTVKLQQKLQYQQQILDNIKQQPSNNISKNRINSQSFSNEVLPKLNNQ